MAQDKIRKRKFAYKVKSGCTTCKRRRVKCDEQRPRCSRCKSSGRTCEGFDTIRIAQTNTSDDGSLSLSWLQPLSTRPDATISETLAFKYFQYSCGAIVHNKFKYRPLFEYILQSAQVEPSVWHATVALGSLQQPENAPAAGDGPIFGFHQYGKAVKLLNQRLHCDANVDSETVLATSLLFATFEVLHKDFAKGSQHINGSLNYLCDLVQVGALNDGIISSSFVDVFARLAISASIFGGPSTRLILDPFEWLASNLAGHRKFSMELAGHAALFCLAAMRYLEDLYHAQTNVEDDKYMREDRIEELRKQLLESMISWQASMKQLERYQYDTTTQQRTRLLRIYITFCKINASTLPTSTEEATELRYDAYISDFWNLLALCQVFLDCGDLETHEQGGLRYRSFTIHIGIIHILWYMTIKCRHPGIRREALYLLKHCHHGEGDTFDGVMIAGYADMVMKLEEGPERAVFAEDVPVERRISKPYFNTKLDDHVLHCEKGDFRLGDEWSKQQPICIFSV